MNHPEDKDSILRELDFHITLSKLIDKGIYDDHFYTSVAQILCDSYLKPSRASVKLNIYGKDYYSKDYTESGDKVTISLIHMNEKIGIVNVFSKEEQHNVQFLESALTRISAIAHKSALQNIVSENEHKISTLFKLTNELIIETDINNSIVFISPSGAKITGFTNAEVIGKNLIDFIYDNDLEIYTNLILYSQKNKRASGELRLKKRSGDSIWVRVSITPIVKDNITAGNIWLICDLSDNHDLLLDLKNIELKYKSIIDASPDVIIVTTLEGDIVLTTPQAGEKLLRDQQIELVGMNIKDFFKEELIEEIDKTLFLFRRSKAIDTIELKFERKDSSEVYLEINSQIINYSDESPSNIFFLIRDINERKSNELQLIYLTKLQEILIEISNTFIHLPVENFSEKMNDSLKKIGEFAGADRIYIFDYDFINLTCSNTYEWCAPGIEPQIETLQNINLKEIYEWVNTHVIGESLYIHNVNELEKSARIRHLLEPQSIQSLLTVPLLDGKDCVGFVGFDYVKNIHEFSIEEEHLLTQFAKILVNIRKKYD